MKKLIVIALVVFAVPSHAAIVGRFDWKSLPAYGAWQSVDSPDQAVGLSKHLWTLSKDDAGLLSLGLFVGAAKAAFSEPSAPLRALGGAVAAVPGSALDCALGTKWGQAWLPKLKTGMVFSYDLSRPGQLHIKPGFIGVGVTYPVGF